LGFTGVSWKRILYYRESIHGRGISSLYERGKGKSPPKRGGLTRLVGRGGSSGKGGWRHHFP